MATFEESGGWRGVLTELTAGRDLPATSESAK